MEEALGLKENVNPVGGLWGSSRRERKLGRLGLGLGAQEPQSSRERAGVLAPNSTLGNRGGVEALEWLKDRVSQHKLATKSFQPEVDSGSRHLRKHVSPAVDGHDKLLGALFKSSAGLSASKEVAGTMAGREQQLFGSHHSPIHSKGSLSYSRNVVDHGAARNNRFSSGGQVAGAKSPWTATNRGVIEIYHDESINPQDHQRLTSRSREASNVKPVEVKLPGVESLIASRGLALKPDIEEHSKVSSLNSPSNVFLSKFRLQQDQVCVQKLPSPQPSSHSMSCSLWSCSTRPGTPYKSTVHQSRGDSVVDRPERSSRGEQHFSSRGQAVELNLAKPESGGSSVKSNDRREASRSEEVKVEGAAEERIPSGAASTVTGSSALRSHINHERNLSFSAMSEELKARIQRGDLKNLYPRRSPTNIVDSCSRSSSGNKQQGSLYTYNKASPLPEEEVSSPPDVRISQCEGKNLQGVVIEDEKGGSGGGSVLHISPALELQNVEHYEPLGHKIDCGTRAAPCDKIYTYADCYSEEKVNNQAFALSRGSSPPPERTRSASTLQAGLRGSSKWSRSNAILSQAETDAQYSPSKQEVVPQDDGLKWNTSSNMDITAVAHGSALLSSLGTGASSSGSSSTPSLLGNSPLDTDTIKSREPTPLVSNAVSSSVRLSKIYNKPRSISKRPRSLGPASRVLRDDVESCNSRISPLSLAPIIDSDSPGVTTAEKDEENSGGQLEHPSSEPRKRKAERDLSGGEGDTSQIFEHSSSVPPSSAKEKDVEVALQAQQQSAVGSTHREHPSQSISKQDVGKCVRPRLPAMLGTKLQEPRISPTGRLVHSGKAVAVPITSKATTSALAGHQSRTAKAQHHNEIDASEASKDSCNRSAIRHLLIKQGAEIKLSSVRESALPVRKPEYGTQNGNDKRILVGAKGPANVGDGRDLAEDMSQDGVSSLDNKENVPIPVVPDLSNCLNSLSLGKEDMLKKDERKLSLSNNDRVSPPLPVAPSSKLPNSKAVEDFREPPSTSLSARSVISAETSFRDQVRISPDGSENAQKYELAGKPARRSPILSEHPAAELSNKAIGLPCNAEAEERAVPSERARDSGASALQSADGTGNENGRGDLTSYQKKMSENSHFVWVNNMRYQKLGKIGKGGSSEVFKVIDSDCNIYAMKKINLKGREHRAAFGFYQEIEYLERLRGKRNVIQLINYEVTNRTVISEDYEEEKILEDACIYMVLEFGEIDFASILNKKRKEMMESDEIVDENWLRFYWKHMLVAVKTIHDERIVHADLKPANFLLVKGELKLIDFGIAKAIQNDTTHIVRDCQVGTLNYMSPEAFMTNSIDEEGRTVKCGRSSDIWSLGCILYQMVYGHTPFSQVDSFYAKIQAITSKTYKIQFPPIPDPWLLDVMKKCLTWDRHNRAQITDLLEHPFLRPELANQQRLAL